MNKNALSQYGWIVVVIIIIAILIGLSVPLGKAIVANYIGTTTGLVNGTHNFLSGIKNPGSGGGGEQGGEGDETTDPSNGTPFALRVNYYLTGDVNFDGIVTTGDVVLFEKHLSGDDEFSELQLRVGDADNSGAIDNSDLGLIKQYIDQLGDWEPISVAVDNAGDSLGNPMTVNGMYTLSGTISNVSILKYLTVNNALVSVNPDGTWIKAIALSEGVNTVTVAAIDNAGNTITATRYMYSDVMPPTLIVDTLEGNTPQTATRLEVDYCVVGGIATDINGIRSVTVNGVAVSVGADGSWSTTVSGLPAGLDTAITVTATNNKGKITTIVRYVHYSILAAS